MPSTTARIQWQNWCQRPAAYWPRLRPRSVSRCNATSFWHSSTHEQAVVHFTSTLGTLRLCCSFCAHLLYLHGLSADAVHCPVHAANIWSQDHGVCGAEEFYRPVDGPFFLACHAQYLCLCRGCRGLASPVSARVGHVTQSSELAGT